MVEHTAERMEELLAKMDEREQKLIAVENRVLRNMAALAEQLESGHRRRVGQDVRQTG